VNLHTRQAQVAAQHLPVDYEFGGYGGKEDPPNVIVSFKSHGVPQKGNWPARLGQIPWIHAYRFIIITDRSANHTPMFIVPVLFICVKREYT